jgi:hypothetical protein
MQQKHDPDPTEIAEDAKAFQRQTQTKRQVGLRLRPTFAREFSLAVAECQRSQSETGEQAFRLFWYMLRARRDPRHLPAFQVLMKTWGFEVVKTGPAGPGRIGVRGRG